MIAYFIDWCDLNHLMLNTSKTKEMVIDFRRKKSKAEPVTILGTKVEAVSSSRYQYSWMTSWTDPDTWR